MARQSPQPDVDQPAASRSAPSPTKHSLTYAPDSQQVKKRARRRKQFYIAGLLSLIISGFWWVPATYRRINYEVALYQCHNHEFPPNTIVVDTTDPNKPIFCSPPSYLKVLTQLASNTGLVYLHQRQDAFSSELVIVTASPDITNSAPRKNDYALNCTTKNLLISNEVDHYMVIPSQIYGMRKLYSGKTDPNDSSHFTIDFVGDGKPGIIDGYLRNGHVILEIRQSASTAPGSSER